MLGRMLGRRLQQEADSPVYANEGMAEGCQAAKDVVDCHRYANEGLSGDQGVLVARRPVDGVGGGGGAIDGWPPPIDSIT